MPGKFLSTRSKTAKPIFVITLDLVTLYPQMKTLLGKTRLKKLIVGNIAEMASHRDAVNASLAAAKQLVDVPADGQHIKFEELLNNDGRHEPAKPRDLLETNRGAPIHRRHYWSSQGSHADHANLSSACRQYWETAQGEPPLIEPAKERMLIVLPLFHIYALSANMLLGIRIGAELILHARFELDKAIAELAEKHVTMFLGVPTMYMGIIGFPGIDKVDLRVLKYCASGGAPLPVETLQEFKRLTGCQIFEGCGMTETSPSGTFTPVGASKPGSCGIPVPGLRSNSSMFPIPPGLCRWESAAKSSSADRTSCAVTGRMKQRPRKA